MSVVINEIAAPNIARIAINRPDKRNAVSPEARNALIDVVSEALGNDDIHAIVLGSTEGHFCAGGDIDSMTDLDVASGRVRMKENHRLVRLLAEAEKPIVAGVEGFAVGAGAGIALLCDTIVLAKGGALGFPFFRIGLTPDYGILFTLARRVGQAKARQILLYAEMLKGQAAIEVGLADDLVEDGQAETCAIEKAQALAKMPPHAFALTKRHLAMEPQSLEEALEMEVMSQSLAFVGSELEEGRAAFLEKRKPDFRN
ncbi:MAG: enoyl-CoA hydratase [Rhodospirillaceae bacterium]|nr:enoyl-CoA hydratase [Rhodospirillaceae bacterium]|tara:strand:- start:8448 stop:9218 length:771 start_codon:yes stop_codon:yes gene_type:complete